MTVISLLTPQQVADRLCMSVRDLKNLAKMGEITPYRILPKTVRYKESQLNAFLALKQVRDLEKPAIAFRAKRAKRVSGVYFLLKDQEIVYVGQSVHIPSRLDYHLRDNDSITRSEFFDSYHYIECEPEHLDMLEAFFIRKFNPLFNVAKPVFKI
jgi:hypothetical protein